jgi:hypothetical protein
MGIERWSDEKMAQLAWIIIITSFLASVTILLTYGWYTSNQEREIMVAKGYNECVVYVPNTGTVETVWQKECQVLKFYPGTVIRK